MLLCWQYQIPGEEICVIECLASISPKGTAYCWYFRNVTKHTINFINIGRKFGVRRGAKLNKISTHTRAHMLTYMFATMNHLPRAFYILAQSLIQFGVILYFDLFFLFLFFLIINLESNNMCIFTHHSISSYALFLPINYYSRSPCATRLSPVSFPCVARLHFLSLIQGYQNTTVTIF